MAETQHIEWLLEGVEAWNARRQAEPFVPDLRAANLRGLFDGYSKLTEELMIPLQGIDLREAQLDGADIWGADLREAAFVNASMRQARLNGSNLEGADLRETDLAGAFLVEVNLKKVRFLGASLRQAHLSGADLTKAALPQIDLKGASLRGATLNGAVLRGTYLRDANVRTRFFTDRRDGTRQRLVTDLSGTRGLTQAQLSLMLGDLGVILPARLDYPEDWPEPVDDIGGGDHAPPHDEQADTPGAPPMVPKTTRTSSVRLDGGRLKLTPPRVPARDDLATLHADLREDLLALAGTGSFNNISAVFDTAFARFLGICDGPFGALDQVRFGVQVSALRLHLEGHREEIEVISPEKSAALDAILLSADLLCARLPDWQAFVSETAQGEPEIRETVAEVGEALAEAADALADDPQIDPAIPETLREQVATATTQAYLAGVAVLGDVARAVFGAVSDFASDTLQEGRKIAIKGLATTLATGAGSSLAKLAGLIPAEFEWVLPWLKYVPAVLG